MKTLILYTSKYGFTKECISYLRDKLTGDVNIQALDSNNQVELSGYDWIIMGSSVYMGKINKKMKIFSEKNTDKLIESNIALFVSCTTPEEVDKYLSEGFSTKVYNASKLNTNFGGKIQRDKLNFFERKLTDMISKTAEKSQETLYKNIDDLVGFINGNDKP